MIAAERPYKPLNRKVQSREEERGESLLPIRVSRCEVEFITTSGRVWAPPCRKPAAWYGISLCCGDSGLYCDSCKRRADGHGDPKQALDMCGECEGRGIKWTKLIEEDERE